MSQPMAVPALAEFERAFEALHADADGGGGEVGPSVRAGRHA